MGRLAADARGRMELRAGIWVEEVGERAEASEGTQEANSGVQ